MLTVYSKPNCPYCEKAKHWLSTNNFSYEIVDIAADPSKREFLIAEGHKTVPQIYFEGKLLISGGFSGLENIETQTLTQMIETSKKR